MNLEVQYVSELTGSGKTEFIINKALICKENYLIVTPNRVLCDEICSRFYMADIEIMEDTLINVHQITIPNPSQELRTLLKTKEKRIIITTHASFMLAIKTGEELEDWNVVLDEEMQVYQEHEVNVTRITKSIIKDTLSFRHFNDDFYLVTTKNPLFAANMASNLVNDSFLKTRDYKDLLDHICSLKYTTLIAKDMLEKFTEAELDDSGKKFAKLYCISLINTEVLKKFKSLTVICSFFEKTVSYHLLKRMGCRLKKVGFEGAFKKHPNSDKITIHYFLNSNWSTCLRKKKITKYKTLENLVYERIMGLVGNREFLYNANVSFRENFSQGTLATSTHGVNKYKKYSELVFMPSLNATSAVVKVLTKFELTRRDVDFARNVLTAYQFVSRGALRDRDNQKDVNIYVMDKRTAVFLKDVFPNAKVSFHDMEKLAVSENERKTPIPNNVKSFMSRVKKRLEGGEIVRQKTLTKYQDYIELYYNGDE